MVDHDDYRVFYLFLLLTAVYAAMIFYLSSQSEPPGAAEASAGIPYFEKIGHAGLYFGLTLSVYMTLIKYPGELNFDVYYVTFLIVLLYALSDEFHQSFVPHRFAALDDVLFDALGSVIFLLFAKSKEYIARV